MILLFHVSEFVVQNDALGKHDNTPVYMYVLADELANFNGVSRSEFDRQPEQLAKHESQVMSTL